MVVAGACRLTVTWLWFGGVLSPRTDSLVPIVPSPRPPPLPSPFWPAPLPIRLLSASLVKEDWYPD